MRNIVSPNRMRARYSLSIWENEESNPKFTSTVSGNASY
jgi:hypothetical protein